MTLNKNEFAELWGVSPRQVSNWIAEGMPAEGTGKKGVPQQIDPGTAIHWRIGHECGRSAGFELSPLDSVLLGLALGYSTATYAQWRGDVEQLVDNTPLEIAEAVGFLRGARLLPWS